MAKQHYFFKLIPPRPSFIEDMSEEERRLMDAHGRYCQEQFAAGRVLLFGPVMAKDGAFGLGILEVDSEQQARQFAEDDPSVKAGEQVRNLPDASVRCTFQTDLTRPLVRQVEA